jgi:hypothetical protein
MEKDRNQHALADGMADLAENKVGNEGDDHNDGERDHFHEPSAIDFGECHRKRLAVKPTFNPCLHDVEQKQQQAKDDRFNEDAQDGRLVGENFSNMEKFEDDDDLG